MSNPNQHEGEYTDNDPIEKEDHSNEEPGSYDDSEIPGEPIDRSHDERGSYTENDGVEKVDHGHDEPGSYADSEIPGE